MQTTEADFETKNYYVSDVKKYLKEYYNVGYRESGDFTTDDIYRIVEASINKKPFGKFLIEFLNNSERCSNDLQSADANIKYMTYCSERFSESGIIKAPPLFENKKTFTNELLRKQLKNWFADVVPSRENIYLLAFALEMNCDELRVFLTKGICDKGVNYKNPSEVAAYHCLNNHKSYSDALKIMEKARAKSVCSNSERKSIYTENYKRFYDRIANEEKLVEYLASLISEQHNPNFSVCIKKCYSELISKCSSNALMDKMIAVNNAKKNISPHKSISFGTIERYLYYYTPVNNGGHYLTSTYAQYDNGNILGKQYNQLSSQKWFFSTLLRRSDMKKMFDGTKKIARDTIITLALFVVCEENPDFNAYEYIEDINDFLIFCRYEPINFSYPYDMFVFMCLQTDDPLASFRKIWKKSWKK